MAMENKTWGAERIRGELLKLGIGVSKRTIQRHVRSVRPPGDGQGWRTFLRNHTVWACDFLQVHDIWFRPLFAFFIVDVNTKEVVHVGATRAPNESWTAQQMRDATPFEYGPQFIIRDHDNKFGASFDRVAEGAGVCVVKTAIRAPLMNAVCERFVGSVRRECLDHIIILGETIFARCSMSMSATSIDPDPIRDSSNVSRCHRRRATARRLQRSSSVPFSAGFTMTIARRHELRMSEVARTVPPGRSVAMLEL